MLSDRQFQEPPRIHDIDGPDITAEMMEADADRSYEQRHSAAVERKRLARGEDIYEQGRQDPF